ncbi:MAG: hypothetical protein RLZZ618_3336 [Pseudomonadota bacterium]|jgi:hypothetical protein
MELLFELLAMAFQFVAELVLQIVFEWLAKSGVQAVRAPFQDRKQVSPALAAVGYAIYGALAGALSLLVFSHSFIDSYPLRLINLIVTPFLAGAVMAALGARRQRLGLDLIRLDRFAYGVVFAFAMGLVRFLFAQQGG